jgi:hypothetical protein
MDNEENFQNILDSETLVRVKEFMKKHDRYNFNESITDLVNLGLANLGYTDKEKALDKFAYNGDLADIDIFTMPKEPFKVIFDIIRMLSQKSIDRNAHRTQILIEARSKGITSSKTTQILEKLKHNGQIYEPIKDSFKIMDY